MTAQQIGHAQKLIEAGERRAEVAGPLNVDRTTLYSAPKIPGRFRAIRSARTFKPRKFGYLAPFPMDGSTDVAILPSGDKTLPPHL